MKPETKLEELVLKEVENSPKEFQIKNGFDFSGKSLLWWKNTTKYALDFLEKIDVKYALIKAYDIPFVKMTDVDILVENENDLVKIYKSLIDRNFRFRHSPFNEKLKLNVRNDSGIEIDFYPDSKWGDLRYAKKNIISKSIRSGTKHGIQAPIPKPEHHIYMIASHSYYHGRLSIHEILDASKTILSKSPNLDEIIELSKKFHLHNGLLMLISSCNWLMKKFNQGEIDKKYIKKLEEISHREFNKKSKMFNFENFPLRYSISSLVLASLSKIMAKNLDNTSSRFDEFDGFVKHNVYANYVYFKLFPRYRNFSYIPNLEKIKS